ncbi:hypothetical protein PV05_00126 [Exophiala xenobiotica]|uniref:SnoaL-like domain-containing protein n=1 Tax=Exophiala xenobiotica TaxID=348802 RepID=A0A0D2EYV9_9EURO|nr:uncharacterized protein PV05_00126 [Exophiala xenobiotica]KIW59860.1 hypothetical protein PV05_00126 [Exophiala xenobiotica]
MGRRGSPSRNIVDVLSHLGRVAVEQETDVQGRTRLVLGSRNLGQEEEDEDPTLKQTPSRKMDLRQFYLDYISTINNAEDLATSLSQFVKEGLIHSHDDSAPMSVATFAEMIRQSQKDLPGLHFDVEMLIVENDAKQEDGNVASRIKLTYKPTPTTTEAFYEHCMYRVERGKIVRIWSVMDGAGQKWLDQNYAAKK